MPPSIQMRSLPTTTPAVNGVAYIPNVLNQYTKVGAVNYVHDGNGNLTNDGTRVSTFDEVNRLTTVLKSGVTSSYKYDALHRRVSKTVGSVVTNFVYNGDELIEERNATGGLLGDYVYSNRLDEVITMTRGANTYYYFQDRLGSVTEVLDTAGLIKEKYTYDPYGTPSVVNSVITNPWRFTGRYYDQESGLYDYRARAYSPGLGRFLQRDPLGYYDSMNLFEYVGNSPLNYIDPYGEDIMRPGMPNPGIPNINFNIPIQNLPSLPDPNINFPLEPVQQPKPKPLPGPRPCPDKNKNDNQPLRNNNPKDKKDDKKDKVGHPKPKQSKGKFTGGRKERHENPRSGRLTEKKRQKPGWIQNPNKRR